MKQAYSYIRFSTRDQLKGDSQRRQSEAAAAWCKANSVQLVDRYNDLGVSAFRGANAQIGALSQFLKLVDQGRIAKGSYLIVESLDRLSRNELPKAMRMFLDILDAGVNIVTLSDNHVYDASKTEAHFTDLIISLTIMSRANEESLTKSVRVGAAWAQKHKLATTVKMTRICPGWLRLSDDRKTFILIPERVAVLNQIFKWAATGIGAFQICRRLQESKAPTFGYSGAWSFAYVKRILRNRAVLGELRPGNYKNRKRVAGEPILDYYPAVVSRELFATVQAIRGARPSRSGPDKGHNVFRKLAFDEATGSSMAYVRKYGRKSQYHYLVAYAATIAKAPYDSWNYDDFLASFLTVCEQAALSKAPVSDQCSELPAARMDLTDTEAQIGRMLDILSRGDSKATEDRLRSLESRKLELQKRIDELETVEVAAPVGVSEVNWTDNQALRDNIMATVKRMTSAQKIDSSKPNSSTESLYIPEGPRRQRDH